jgi:HNH endonuclease
MPQEYDEVTFEIDHIIAASHGGLLNGMNLCLACFSCNSFKGTNLSGRDTKTRKTVALFNPRRHSWPHHFRWSGSLLVGRTPAGRATIATLRINLAHRVAHRQELIDEGVFPPA